MWSLYSPHGPVFRTMLQVDRQQHGRQARQGQGQGQQQRSRADYGYILHCPSSGESSCCGWQDLPGALLSAAASSSGCGSSAPPLLSGPLWVGPLHSHRHLQLVHTEAAARGWLQEGQAAGSSVGFNGGSGSSGGAAPVLPATRKGSIGSLHLLLELLLEEAAAEAEGEGEAQGAAGGAACPRAQRLPPFYLRMNDVGRVGQLVGPPSRTALAAELQRR